MTQTDELVEDLAHYGVKGMKWGVRRSDKQLEKLSQKRGKTTPDTKMTRRTDSRGDRISKDDRKWEKAAGKTKTGIKAYNEAAEAMNAKHIGRINSKKRYQGDLFANGREKDLAAYMGEMEAAFTKEYTASLSKAFGESPSGKYKVVPARGKGGPAWTIEYTDKVKHADPAIKVELTTDKQGHILSVKVVGDLEHGDILEHYGIKGMKWGVRRTRAQIDAASADAAKKKETMEKIKKNRGSTDPLSNAELRALNERLQLEENYAKLMGKTGDRSQTKGQKAAKAGSKFAKELVVDSGKQVLKNVVTTQSQKALNNKIEEAIKKKQGE